MYDPKLGIALLDRSSRVLFWNDEAVRVIAFPITPSHIDDPGAVLGERLHDLVTQARDSLAGQLNTFRSGARSYVCRVIHLDARIDKRPEFTAVLLRRQEQPWADRELLETTYGLSPRERQCVEYLLLGLTTKEIAARMRVSTSTINTFFHLIMLKTRTSRRCDIVRRYISPLFHSAVSA